MSYKFSKYKEVSVLKTGGNSLDVVLLENKKGERIVRKRYNPDKEEHVESFHKEIRILSNVESYKYVTHLLDVDYDNYTFWVTYCGVQPENIPENKKKASARTRDFYDKTGLKYVKSGRQTFVTHWKNYCLLDGEIYIIDFGSKKWEGAFANDYKLDKGLAKSYLGKKYKKIKSRSSNSQSRIRDYNKLKSDNDKVFKLKKHY